MVFGFRKGDDGDSSSDDSLIGPSSRITSFRATSRERRNSGVDLSLSVRSRAQLLVRSCNTVLQLILLYIEPKILIPLHDFVTIDSINII